jgi:Cu(I)/Ag(I) efflux system membrane fusion protein
MRRTIVAITITALVGSFGLACRQQKESDHAAHAPGAAKDVWYCPMHPQVTADKPGKCPICQMDLVKKEGAIAPAERKVLYYRNPMNPAIRSDKPMKDDMGMDYVPVYEDEARAPAGGVAGRGSVDLSPERRQLLGVRSEPVRRQEIGGEIRTVGRVSIDESRVHHQHTKYQGFVEKLYVDFTGAPVRRGQPLLALYSPELVASQEEYLVALRTERQLSRSSEPSVSRSGPGLLDAARRRLMRYDMTPAQIRRLEETGKPLETVDLHADMGGIVTEKMAFHGMQVTPGMTLFDIADVSRLWVQADVYERDLGSVRNGQAAEVSLPYDPGRSWKGRVTFISPTLDAATRTLKVRVEVANQDGHLKPDMVADVVLRTTAESLLVVPESARIRTGERTLVFVDRGEGRLEPREVRAGSRAGDVVAVLSGLTEGERVVVGANFLLDSESSLRAAIAGTR